MFSTSSERATWSYFSEKNVGDWMDIIWHRAKSVINMMKKNTKRPAIMPGTT